MNDQTKLNARRLRNATTIANGVNTTAGAEGEIQTPIDADTKSVDR